MALTPTTFRCVPIVLLALLAGCAVQVHKPATPPATGDASWRVKQDADTAHYTLAMGDVATGANVLPAAPPIYPADQLAACPPPVEVEALVIVGGDGKVGEVRVADESRAAANRRSFIAAVRAAVIQWTFAPLKIDHWAADAEGNSHVVDSETKPFSLGYVFRFACHAGKGQVSSNASAGGHT